MNKKTKITFVRAIVLLTMQSVKSYKGNLAGRNTLYSSYFWGTTENNLCYRWMERDNFPIHLSPPRFSDSVVIFAFITFKNISQFTVKCKSANVMVYNEKKNILFHQKKRKKHDWDADYKIDRQENDVN